MKKLFHMATDLVDYESIDLSKTLYSRSSRAFLQRHQLRLGKDSRTRITEMVASLDHSYMKSIDMPSQYMNYIPAHNTLKILALRKS
ncbi:hypothetical protein Nepgr_019848 [Nepenthes gracilis]|uniref:Uncharacterized protein n=1 Tax=Nepenthes gracilis TaxID=150966 RepID=A0AAD3SW12_NEPGR|nr:hypothetical protein Nepgr_019848 [Nepenthes gracilis]